MKEVILTSGELASVDEIDYYFLNQFSWHLNRGYARASHGVYMHQMIFQQMKVTVPKDKDIDHEDRNRLNNQRGNLRLVSRSDNKRNSDFHEFNSLRGTCYHKKSGKFQASISIKQRDVYLGLFSTLEEAIEARRKAEIAYDISYGREI